MAGGCANLYCGWLQDVFSHPQARPHRLRGFASSKFSQANCEFVAGSAPDREGRAVTSPEKAGKPGLFLGPRRKFRSRPFSPQMGLKNA
jgi:hypothetical protein